MGFSTYSVVVDDVHFHLFLFSFSSWFDCDWLWLVWWYWMSENEWKLFIEGWKWIWQSFFLQWWKQTRNEMKFQLYSFCFSFLQCLMIVSNSRKTKTIVILFGLWFEKTWLWSNWSKWSKSQPHLQRMFWICFVFFLLFDLRIVENEKCGKRFEICLFATIGEIRERINEWMKSVIIRIC